MSGHSFFDDNTGRFYPFNEELIQERRSSLPEELLTLLKRGIADTGIVVAAGRSLIGTVYAELYKVTKYGLFFNVSNIELNFSWTDKTLQTPFNTVKAETADGETFGYLVLGHAAVWETLPEDYVWERPLGEEGIPLQRSRISWIDQRQVTHLTAWNTERLRATNAGSCPPIEWQENLPPEGTPGTAGITVTNQPVVFKEGYNCSIAFNAEVNRISIQPVAGAGMGVTAKDLQRRFGETKPVSLNRSRYDGALEYGNCAYKINEASGPIVNIYTSHHFKVTSQDNVVTIRLISAGRYTDLCK